MRKHLAIMGKLTIEAILSGRKTIETRFSQHRIVPFGQVEVGDIVYMKPPGEEIIGQFKVKKIFSYAGMTVSDLEKIWLDYGEQIRMGNKVEDKRYQENKMSSKFGTLIFIDESERFITSPIKYKKSDQRGWVVIK